MNVVAPLYISEVCLHECYYENVMQMARQFA